MKWESIVRIQPILADTSLRRALKALLVCVLRFEVRVHGEAVHPTGAQDVPRSVPSGNSHR